VIIGDKNILYINFLVILPLNIADYLFTPYSQGGFLNRVTLVVRTNQRFFFFFAPYKAVLVQLMCTVIFSLCCTRKYVMGCNSVKPEHEVDLLTSPFSFDAKNAKIFS
jgi:hypothetical protein